MKKLPVVAAIIDAYRFTFGHLGTIIGLIWLPLVLVTLLSFLPEVGGASDDGANNPIAAGTSALEGIATFILTQLLYAIIYVAVTRQALDLRKGTAMIHFALGLPEFRMFGASLLFALLSFACFLPFMVVVLADPGLVSGASANPAFALIAVVAGLAAVYVLIRLGFLLVPATTIENRVDLTRGWVLTRGNFWRIVLVLIAISMPIVALEGTTLLILMGKDLAAALPPLNSTQAVAQQHIAVMEDVIRRHMAELLGVTLILAPFNLGLSISASAFGYRALAPEGTIRT